LADQWDFFWHKLDLALTVYANRVGDFLGSFLNVGGASTTDQTASRVKFVY
jgi:hypothetical protein